ncbi:peptidase M16 family [Butyrivibrio proteoclasticus B316]|uniref:Peptidase M16 family n=1 Tax=Butyrivibrio proteoclasticus (strain ATCC 51982 / DSM 14932 / B316) TaxID=515622 RepID=E0S2C9_BUTPB|nr:insulinase family protein [Butyrivibrio proteoclasticus]ADL33954.1 peptidase M16 family [Butyrivibrio proteoclasticus B316]
MRLEELATYEIIEKRRIEDLNSDSYILRHRKTGARVTLLSNDDNNKVFTIGFRTPPKNSTGVAHIIEHTVLCGSREFPVKDPFVELVKGSLNTFLNAMTFPDKTVYPIASCNDADFQNLMHVYLDAVFYPNIYKTDKIFKQEGWHYEMEDKDSDLTINGVVYNEMKGAFSSADDVLSREIQNSLYPDITYGIESGGDPDVIPELTYEEYLDFHRKYYHPSNSYIYLYGDMDMAEKLDYIDKNYLSNFDYLKVDSEIQRQQAFDAPREIHKPYSILEGDSMEQNTYLSYNFSVGSTLDRKLYVAFDILDYALCSAPGAPIKKALIDKGIGQDVYSEYDNGLQQPVFSIIAKNADAAQKDEFVNTIREVLEQQVRDGIDKKSLLAGLNFDEFKYREADFGRFPKGLLYGLQVFDSWLYDDNSPWINVEANDTFAQLKEDAKGRYFEELIQKYLLDNTHRTVLLLEPVQGLTEKKDEELRAKLEAYKASLSADDIDKIVRETKELKEYQEQPDDPEDLRKIPLLKLEDLKKEADKFVYELKEYQGVKILHHDVFTNEIDYISFVFDLKNIDAKYLPYVSVLKKVLGMLDTDKHTYGDLYNEINIYTGGISGAISTYTNSDDVTQFETAFEISVKVLHSNLDKAFELVQEIITSTRFDDTKRLKEIFGEQYARLQSDLASAGHQTAALRAMSYISPAAYVSDCVSGIGYFRNLEQLIRDINTEEGAKQIVDTLGKLSRAIFRADNLLVDITGTDKEYQGIPENSKKFADSLYTDTIDMGRLEIHTSKKNEAFKTAGQVQYVCRAGNFASKGLRYNGALRVLKVMMGYDYLWKNIRVIGGAYGCMSSYAKNGDSAFVTYRDPNLKNSIDVFEKAADYLRNFDDDDRTILQYIIGAISDLDTPKTPSGKGAYGLTAYLCNARMENIQRNRDELLGTTKETIRSLADYVDAFMQDECLCVIGTNDKIDEAKDLFDNVEQLVNR